MLPLTSCVSESDAVIADPAATARRVSSGAAFADEVGTTAEAGFLDKRSRRPVTGWALAVGRERCASSRPGRSLERTSPRHGTAAARPCLHHGKTSWTHHVPLTH